VRKLCLGRFDHWHSSWAGSEALAYDCINETRYCARRPGRGAAAMPPSRTTTLSARARAFVLQLCAYNAHPTLTPRGRIGCSRA